MIGGLLLSLFLFACAPPASDGQSLGAGWYDSLWVSPGGDTALFMYSRYNFFPHILGQGTPVLNGPDLPGHHPNDTNPYEDSDLYMVRRDANGQWGQPINLSLNDVMSDCCAMMSGDEIFYQKGTDIYIATMDGDHFRDQERLSVSASAVDGNPHFDSSTQTLYWASGRGGNMDIWAAQRLGYNEWSTPMPVPGNVNTPANEDQPFVAGSVMRFSRDSEFGNGIARLENGEWTQGEIEWLGYPQYHAEFSLSADGQTARFVASDITAGKLFFMQTKRDENGRWQPASTLPFGMPD